VSLTRRLPIAGRFWLVLFVLVAAMSAMAFFAFSGLNRVNHSADALAASIRMTARGETVRDVVLDLNNAIVTVVAIDDPGLSHDTGPRVEADIARLTILLEGGRGVYGATEDSELDAELIELGRLGRLWRTAEFAPGGPRSPDVGRRLKALVVPMVAEAEEHLGRESARAEAAGRRASKAHGRTSRHMILSFAATLVLGVAMMLWLIRTVVPRTRDYSAFAAQVADGQLGRRLEPRGSDELSTLGRSLDHLVGRHETEVGYQRGQAEFAHAMQVTASEDEAHVLIKRHVERSLAGSKVVVLNRNNSDDRLEARTAIEPGSPIAEGLDGAGPRSCLAIRFADRHEGGGDHDPLLSCEVCGRTPDLATCSPLLVGGEVIGSVLVNHEQPLDAYGELRIRDTVIQAAPVLANLRNLAIAEVRASTDALTGLPNNRAVKDTLKRMVAQASRSRASLGVALLDLDHFKQINDTHGHGRGDEVLAVVAQTMKAAVRAGDFVGRYGGEEFVVVLPDTGPDGALAAMEKVRAAIAQISLPSVDRAITASIGLAMLPGDGMDTDTLVRNADRALYDAKSKGRNRVECAGGRPRTANGAAPPQAAGVPRPIGQLTPVPPMPQ
jgi:diguanylate cyclase (GGDEF)-like protein